MDFLRSRFQGRSLDLVVPVGAPAVRFVSKSRELLLPNIPVVFTGVDPRMFPPEASRTNATLATQRVNLPGIIEDILQMQPDTTNIVVIFGASPLEKFWVSECRREFQSFTNRVGFTLAERFGSGSHPEHVAALPPRSFILFGMFVTDAAGVPYDNDECRCERLHAVANAPIFGYFASQFGSGTIGGGFTRIPRSVRGPHAAIRILHGERPERIRRRI